MSKMIQEPPIADETSAPAEERPAPRGTMLFTMLLLIAGFTLSSVMLLHYSFQAANRGKSSPGFSLASLKEKGQAFTLALASKQSPSADLESASSEKSRNSAVPGIPLFRNGDRLRWPKLKLTGFGSSTDGSENFAIINGRKVNPGQLIDGKVKLVEVRSQDVVVEYQGETRALVVDVHEN